MPKPPVANDLLSPFEHFPRPLHYPRRDYTYLTEEPSITRVSRALGKEPQPYQRFVWAVGTEYRWGYNLQGQLVRKYHYPDVLVSTPRQAGKTTLLRPVRVYRMLINPHQHLFATAQSQKHASRRMLDMVNEVDRSMIGPLFKGRRGKGDAGIRLLANGADLAQFTPNEEALHGETPPWVDWDEIWKFEAEEANAILGGIRPGMATFDGAAQRWMVSTRGTLASTFMNGLIDDSLAGNKPGLCFISWELPPGLDPYDPASWWLFHPALGNTISEEFLRGETEIPEGEWLRAYCNRLTEVEATLMPMEDWDLLASDFETLARRDLADVTVGFEVGAGNENAAVVAAWHEPDGRPVLKLLHQAPGTVWLTDYLRGLHAKGVRRFAADGKGPVRRVVDTIRDELTITELGYQERQLGDSLLLTAARDDQNLIHDGSRSLRIAIANAQVRKSNGVEIFDRDRSLQPIPSLIAGSVALYLDVHRPLQYTPGMAS